MANDARRPAGLQRGVYSLLLLAALTGAVGEGASRVAQARRWLGRPAIEREEQLYGPARELLSHAWSELPPDASLLLLSDWDPALIAYYLHPRRIYQTEATPEAYKGYMDLPPSPYPRRAPESFAVDWIVRIRSVRGRLVAMIWKAGAGREPGP